jgi:hypothetical protein
MRRSGFPADENVDATIRAFIDDDMVKPGAT